MVSRYYEPGDRRADKVHQLFSTVASRYDLINDVHSLLLHRAWKRRLLRVAALVPGELGLDLCCGTGDVTLALAAAGVRATGLDFCQPMLRVAMRRSARAGAAGASFLQGDAQALPFADAQFDVVTISYGLRNLADWQRGLTEMYRVLRPTGRLVILDFARPTNRLWRGIYLAYLKVALPCFGWVLSGDAQAYAYILESLKHYPDPEVVLDFLAGLGAVNARVIPLLGGVMTIHVARRPGVGAA